MSSANTVKAKRGRKPIDIGVYELQDVIKVVEELHPNGKFDNRSQLWDAVAQSGYWQTRSKNKPPLTVSPQTVMLIAKKNNLTIATPVGQRGRQKGCGPVPNAGRKAKRIPAEAEKALRGRFALTTIKTMPKILDNVARGSIKAAVKAMCLDCTCEQRKEIRKCEIKACPLWAFRPYKKRKAK